MAHVLGTIGNVKLLHNKRALVDTALQVSILPGSSSDIKFEKHNYFYTALLKATFTNRPALNPSKHMILVMVVFKYTVRFSYFIYIDVLVLPQ